MAGARRSQEPGGARRSQEESGRLLPPLLDVSLALGDRGEGLPGVTLEPICATPVDICQLGLSGGSWGCLKLYCIIWGWFEHAKRSPERGGRNIQPLPQVLQSHRNVRQGGPKLTFQVISRSIFGSARGKGSAADQP